MEFILPKDLAHPRVYFTEFDRVTFSQVAWNDEDIKNIKQNIVRKIKLLGLIKGMIVVAVSHLFESELAQEILFENPILIEKGVIVPALISKYKSFSDFLEYKRNYSNESDFYKGREKDDMNALLKSYVKNVISWNVDNTNDWFKKRLLNDLNDRFSVLRYNLKSINKGIINQVISYIEDCKQPSRGDIYQIGKNTTNKTMWHVLSNYADFIYYLSGALAVNSEGVLPQENLIEFSITDLINKKNNLSEYEMFYRIFVDIIEEKMQKIFPVDILDNLSFTEVIELRNGLYHQDFINKYNFLLDKTKNRMNILDSEKLVLTIKEVYEFEDCLKKEFTEKIETELVKYKSFKKRKQGLEVIKSTSSFIPIYGTIDSIKQIIVNFLIFLGFENNLNHIRLNFNKNLNKVKKMVINSAIENKVVLISYLSEINEKYSSKLL